MKKLMITAAALMVAVAAYGQGSFFFNTHDVAAGNNVNFTLNGAPATSAANDHMVEVLAGPDLQHLTALTPTLTLNGTGARAGYTSPLSATYTVPSVAGGATAVVAYRAFQGTSFDTATTKSDLITTVMGGTTPLSVALVSAPTPPIEINLGTGTVAITGVVPEPTTLALGALGMGALLLIRRRK